MTAEPCRRKTAVAIFLLSMFCSPVSAADTPTSGRYGPLSIAIQDGTAYGVFFETRVGNGTDSAPQFSCIFLLQGPLEGSKASVLTWFPGDKERIRGVLDLGRSPSLQLQEDQPGCGMASGQMVSEPYSLMLDARHDEWVGVGVVTAKKAVLRQEPVDTGIKSPYVVQFDPVAVLERRPGWVRIQYLGEDDSVKGWVRENETSIAPGTRK
jgi:hypothetical protein